MTNQKINVTDVLRDCDAELDWDDERVWLLHLQMVEARAAVAELIVAAQAMVKRPCSDHRDRLAAALAAFNGE